MNKEVEVDEVVIKGVTYVPKGSQVSMPEPKDGMKYCVVRTYSAGVHIGYVKDFGDKYPQQATLINSRRLHYWDGACSLSQVAMDGVDANNSRVAMEVPELILTDIIEIIPCSEKAMKLFKEVKVWKK